MRPSFIDRPRLVRVTPVFATALPHGRTPIRVVASGQGTLVVGDVRVPFAGGIDQVVLVESAPEVEVVVRRWFFLERRSVSLCLFATAPGPPPGPRLAEVNQERAGSSHQGKLAPVVVRTTLKPEVRLPRMPP